MMDQVVRAPLVDALPNRLGRRLFKEASQEVLVRSNQIKRFYGESVTGGPIRIHSLVAESLPSKEWARVRFPLDALSFYFNA